MDGLLIIMGHIIVVSLMGVVDFGIPAVNSEGIHHRPFHIEDNTVLISSPIGLDFVD